MKVITERRFPILEVFINKGIAIFSIVMVFLFARYLGSIIFQDAFNTQFLYSLLLLPIIGVVNGLCASLIFPFTVKSIIDSKTNRIKVTSGWYNLFEDDMEIKNIENIELNYTMVGKICGYRNLVIRNYGSYISIPYVKNYDEVVKYVKDVGEKQKTKKTEEKK